MSSRSRRIAAPLLLNAAMAIALRLALPFTLAEGGERYQYYAMARAHGFPQNCPSFHCFRALPALLAGLWPIETADAFLLTGVLFETLAGAALWCLTERFDGRREVACFATLWFWVTWGPIQSFTDPLLIADPVQAFWSIASLSLLIAGRFVAALPLLVSGAAVKEAVLLVPVIYVLYVVIANDPARKKPVWLAAIVIAPVSAWILFRIYLAARFSYHGGAIASQVQQLPVMTEWFTSLAPWPSNLVAAALHIYGAFGAAWLAAAFGLRIATWRQRALTLASLPAMLLLSILQSPDRALASFPYAVLIPAAIFVAQ